MTENVFSQLDRLGPYTETFKQLRDATIDIPGVDAMFVNGSRSTRLPKRYIGPESDFDVSWIYGNHSAKGALLNIIGNVLSLDSTHPNYLGGEPYRYWWVGDNKEMEVGANFFSRGHLLKRVHMAYQSEGGYTANCGFLGHKVVQTTPVFMHTDELIEARAEALKIPVELRASLLRGLGQLLNKRVEGARPAFRNAIEFMHDVGGENGTLSLIMRMHYLINRMHYMPGSKHWEVDSILMTPDISEEINVLLNHSNNWGNAGRPIRQAISGINDKFKPFS